VKIDNFFAELKRRNVYKVAIAYAIVGWLLVQVATQVFPFFEIPNWGVRLIVLFIVIGFPVALIIAWAFGRLPFYRQTGESISQKSIAILPFENLSEEKANAYFAEGVQNEILTRLAAVRDLKVISRTSTAKYQSKPDNLKTIAQELGVSTVLEGAVQKAGDKVRVNCTYSMPAPILISGVKVMTVTSRMS
jgi:uncharacterized membrane protein YedE/YeeE